MCVILVCVYLKYVEDEIDEGGESSASGMGLHLHAQVLISDFNRGQFNLNPEIQIHPRNQGSTR